jgi:hypothetical protein
MNLTLTRTGSPGAVPLEPLMAWIGSGWRSHEIGVLAVACRALQQSKAYRFLLELGGVPVLEDVDVELAVFLEVIGPVLPQLADGEDVTVDMFEQFRVGRLEMRQHGTLGDIHFTAFDKRDIEMASEVVKRTELVAALRQLLRDFDSAVESVCGTHPISEAAREWATRVLAQ